MVRLSKSKLLRFAQCPRRLWLEHHRPELAAADDSAETEHRLATGRSVGELARELLGGAAGGHLVTFEHGVQGAIDATRELLAGGGTTPIFEATFEHDGVMVRVDILDRSAGSPAIIEVKSSASVKDEHLPDCAIQAWTLRELGIPVTRVSVAHIDTSFVYDGTGYDGLLVTEDVTEAIAEHTALVPDLVQRARATLESRDEPDVPVGTHCGAPYDCAFFAHCAPPHGDYPVWDLGGGRKRLFEFVHAGYRDLCDVPSDLLHTDHQRRIQQQTALGTASIGAELRDFVRALPFPRLYLDFETIAFAVPIWPGTRPYEALPFQWSLRIDDGRTVTERAFLDLSGAPPMRACAEQLLAAAGTVGPIVVYTPYEHQVIRGLARRFPDLAPALDAVHARLVDLYPVTKAHYYHPDMHGSWSIKAVAPTVAPELGYDTLGEVRDGGAAGRAYLEAIDPRTAPARVEELRRNLLEYCGHDTLALLKLVEAFARG